MSREAKVVALEPGAGTGCPTATSRETRAEASGDERREEKKALLKIRAAAVAQESRSGKHRYGGGDVGSNGHKSGMTKRELARVPVHEVQRVLQR